MSTEFLPWAIEATVMVTYAILFSLALRPVLSRAFGVRAAILIWWLVPLALIVGVLPARSVDVAHAPEIQTVISLDGLGTAAAAARDIGQSFSVTWKTVIAAVWLTGAGLMLVALGRRQARFRRFLGVLRPVGKRLMAADGASAGPAVLGVVRPRVIVPRDFGHRFDTRQRRLMLAHEYTHLKRGDPAWNLVAAGLRCLFWFNPLVHVAATRFRHDQELACDAAVLASRRHAQRAYASALLALEEDLPVPAFGFGAHPLQERIHMLVALKRISPRRHLTGVLVAVSLALAVAAAAWAATPETSKQPGTAPEQFAFDIEVTVDGRSQVGILTLTGDVGVSPIGEGQPRMFANDTLRLEHNDEESGWAAEVTIDRMPEQEFWVTATIRRNDEVVATPRMIIGSEAPASIETRDSETGEIAYRLVLTPVEPEASDVGETPALARSAQIFLTVGGTSAAQQIDWPDLPARSSTELLRYDGDPAAWQARLAVKRLKDDQLSLCIEDVEHETSAITGSPCMRVDLTRQSNAYMVREDPQSRIAYRLDFIPTLHASTD
jgi:bla regulator protein blaR1